MNVTHVLDLDTARALTANSRGRWPTQKATASVKDDMAKVLTGCDVRFDGRVTIDVTLYQRTRRRRDPDNVAGIAKPMIDAIVKAGIVKDDSHKHVDWVRYSIAVDPEVKEGTVEVEVTVAEAPTVPSEVAA